MILRKLVMIKINAYLCYQTRENISSRNEEILAVSFQRCAPSNNAIPNVLRPSAGAHDPSIVINQLSSVTS